MYILTCEKGSLIIKYPNGDSQMYQCRFLTCCEHDTRVNITLNARIIATGRYNDYMLNGLEYPNSERLLEALKDAFSDVNGTNVNVTSMDVEVEQQIVKDIVDGIGTELKVADISDEAAQKIADAIGSDMEVGVKPEGITAESFTTEALQAIADTTIASMTDEPVTLQDGAVNLDSVDQIIFDKIREAVDEIIDPVTGEKSRIKVDTDIEISEAQVEQIADKTAEAIIPAIADGITIKEGGINADSFGADALESIAQSVSEKMADEGESAIKEGGITSESFSSDALDTISDSVAEAVVDAISMSDGVAVAEEGITAESLSEDALEAIAAAVAAKLAERDVYCTEAQYTAWESAGTLDPTKRYFICEG